MLLINSGGSISHYLFFVWLLSVLFLEPRRIQKVLTSREIIWLLVFVFFQLLSTFFSYNFNVAIHRTIGLFEAISPIWMYLILKDSDETVYKTVSILSFLFVLFNIVRIYIILKDSFLGLRQGVSGDEMDVSLFHAVYSFVLLTTGVVCLIKAHYNKVLAVSKMELFILMMLLLALIVIVARSLFMTALLSMVIGFVITLFYGRRHWLLKIVIVLALFAALFVVFFDLFTSGLFGSITNDNGFLVRRFGEINSVLSGGGTEDSDLGARSSLFGNSFRTFVTHPLFGINHHVSSGESTLYVAIGNHSEWIDSLALYGIFAFCLFIYMIQSVSIRYRSILFPVFIVYFILGVLNPVFYFPQNVMVFFIVPCLYDCFTHRENDSGRFDTDTLPQECLSR